MTSPRQSTYPVHNIFIDRWSPRSFDAQAVSEEDVLSMIEAARWAPSAYNSQPWRFIYSLRDDQNWQTYLDLLDPFNRSWAHQAGAIVFLASDTLMSLNGDEDDQPAAYHSFDAGAAWAQLALQASALGYGAHAMAGIYKDKAARILGLPERYQVQIAIALGRRGPIENLAQELQLRESPSPRKPLDQIAFLGVFQHE